MLAIYMKCPSCGAELEYQADKDIIFCSHCGTRILLKEQREEHIYRTVDEVALREIEYQKFLIEERKKAKEIRKKKKARASLVLLVVAGFCLVVGFTGIDNPNGFFSTLCGILGFLGIFSGLAFFIAVLSWAIEAYDDDDVLGNKVTRIHRGR